MCKSIKIMSEDEEMLVLPSHVFGNPCILKAGRI